MNTPDEQAPSSSINVQDIFYVIFKHKWKILLFSLLGLGAASTIYFTKGAVYESRAKLLVRYVHGHSDLDSWQVQEQAGGRYGEHVINTEMEILRTWDVAFAVADKVGPDRLLPKIDQEDEPAAEGKREGEQPDPASGEGEESELLETVAPDAAGEGRRTQAAALVLGGLRVNSAKGSNVMHLAFQHPDPALVRPTLNALIEQYFLQHAATHRPIRKELDELTSRAASLDNDIKEAQFELGELQKQVRSEAQGDTAASLEAQISAVKSGLFQAEADLAQQSTKLELLGQTADVPEDEEDATISDVPVPQPHVVQQFQESMALERSLQMRRIALLEKFKPNQGSLLSIQSQIDAEVKKREKMLKEHPGLGMAASPQGVIGGAPLDLRGETALLAALKTKVDTFKKQLDELDTRFRSLSALEGEIADKQLALGEMVNSSKELAENLKTAKVEKTITEGKLPNISILQHPSIAVEAIDEKTKKIALGLAAAGVALGVGLAFLIEFVLDRRVKRPVEIENRMRLPLMLSIPKLEMKRPPLRIGHGDSGHRAGEHGPGVPGQPGADSVLQPYAEAIRDRLVYYFALNEMNHRPKMIALAGLSDKAGASSLAAGVAAAFGNVDARTLLVDLNPGANRSSSSHLLADRGVADLPSTRTESGMEFGVNAAGENLFVASLSNGNGNSASSLAPRKFYDLIPKFRSSDFDYIIFDMPPISDTSPTSTMAGFMDKVLLVLDAENTDRGTLRKSYGELMRGKADVSCVFNKTRTHGPRWALGEV